MAQQEIFYATLAEHLTQLGYDVKMFTEYQFRINGRLDVYPVNRRWHDIKENQRGDYEDIFDFCKKFFQNQERVTPPPPEGTTRTKEGDLLDARHPSHRMFECAGYSEGLRCCIDKHEVLEPILKKAVDNAIANIRALPWWKRLFNKF